MDARSNQDGIRLAVTDAGSAGLFVTASVLERSHERTAPRLYEVLAEALAAEAALPVHERAFVSSSHVEDLVASRRKAFSAQGIDPETPLSIMQADPPRGAGESGIVLHAVRATAVGLVTTVIAGDVSGRRWYTDVADHILLQMGGSRGDTGEGSACEMDLDIVVPTKAVQ